MIINGNIYHVHEEGDKMIKLLPAYSEFNNREYIK